MNILISTGHPAQVHNFRIFREQLIKRGHKVFWLASQKDISDYLLNVYGIEYTQLKRPKKGIVAKLFTLLQNTWIAAKVIRKNKIDFVVTRINPGVVMAAFLMGKKQVGLTDTEAVGIYDLIFSKFLGALITSTSFERSLRKDQIRINANIELFYLHPNYFNYDKKEVYQLLKIPMDMPFAVVRFVSTKAFHDEGTRFISEKTKVEVVEKIKKYAEVFISSEDDLPPSIQQYQIKFPYEKVHVVMKEATMFYGESATMASECAILGTPAIYVNAQSRGYTNDEQRMGLLHYYKTDDASQAASIDKVVELLENKNLKEDTKQKQLAFLQTKIDPVAFLIWFIESYPESKRILNENPDYQYNFK